MTTTENYFKALGWEFGSFAIKRAGSPIACRYSIKSPDGEGHNSLPNITQSYPDFKKWVLEKMEEEGMAFHCSYGAFIWNKIGSPMATPPVHIKNNEILEAAVKAATKYWEGK